MLFNRSGILKVLLSTQLVLILASPSAFAWPMPIIPPVAEQPAQTPAPADQPADSSGEETSKPAEEAPIADNDALRLKCFEDTNARMQEEVSKGDHSSKNDQELADYAKAEMAKCDAQFPSSESDIEITFDDEETKKDEPSKETEKPELDKKGNEPTVAVVEPKPEAAPVKKSSKDTAKIGFVYNTRTGSSLMIIVDTGIRFKQLEGSRLNISANAAIFSTGSGYLVPKLELRTDTDYKKFSKKIAKFQNLLHLPFIGAEFSRDKALDRSWQLSGYAENRVSSGEKTVGYDGTIVSGDVAYGVHAGFGGTGGYAFIPFVGAHGSIGGKACQPFGAKRQHEACVYTKVKAKIGLYEAGAGIEAGTEYNYKFDDSAWIKPYVESVGGGVGVIIEDNHDVSGEHSSGAVGISGKIRW